MRELILEGNYTRESQALNNKVFFIAARVIEKFSGISYEEMKSPDRRTKIVRAREIISNLCYNQFGYTLSQICKLLSKHHSSILHFVNQYDEVSILEIKRYGESRYEKQMVYLFELVNEELRNDESINYEPQPYDYEVKYERQKEREARKESKRRHDERRASKFID